jgi:hypothetical protein
VPSLHPLVAANQPLSARAGPQHAFPEVRIIRSNERALDYLFSLVSRSRISHNLPRIISGVGRFLDR